MRLTCQSDHGRGISTKAALRPRGRGAERSQEAAEAGGAVMSEEWQAVQAQRGQSPWWGVGEKHGKGGLARPTPEGKHRSRKWLTEEESLPEGVRSGWKRRKETVTGRPERASPTT